jgi:hypothetical protein
MTSTKYIGMDVHKESISIAVMNSVGKMVMECVLETKASMILQFIEICKPPSEALSTRPRSPLCNVSRPRREILEKIEPNEVHLVDRETPSHRNFD